MSEFLEVYGAKTHNLKNVSVKIPKNKMTVITGLSGSGKSSLAFNTIYAVGQQKYLESLSSYARMFVWGVGEEAEVDEIIGLSPTISIDQKTTSRNPRSTVGTVTEIYDYYKLLFLNIGERSCIRCGSRVRKDSLTSMIDWISRYPEGTRFMVRANYEKKKGFHDFSEIKKELLDLGFIRFSFFTNDDEICTINDTIEVSNIPGIHIIVDRLVVQDFQDPEASTTKRLKDSMELALKVWQGKISIVVFTDTWREIESFSSKFACSQCGHVPEELSISSFSFNAHAGACPECHGLGVKKVFLEERVVNDHLTLSEGAVIAPWFWGNYFFELLSQVSSLYDVRLNIPYRDLSKREKELILYGTGDDMYTVRYENEQGVKNTYTSRFEGVIHTLTRRYFDGGADKWHYDPFIVDMDCPQCNGKRLQAESLSVRILGKDIGDLSDMTADAALSFLRSLPLSSGQAKLVAKVMKNACERLEFLWGVGLNYITISRKSGTLSWWEAQRIRLATQIGTKLEGIIYVLDEPSIGLHPRDNDMLIENLKKLRDIGNTLIVVEHDEDIMRSCDYIIDVGPGAGVHGGSIIAEGTLEEVIAHDTSVTGPYLSHKKQVHISRKPRKQEKFLQILGASQNNLKDIDVSIPLSNFVVVTGVSGSGKSSLVNDILANYLANTLNGANRQVGKVKEIRGSEWLDKVVIIDQSPIWKTPRSNPATYTGVFTPIREIFSMTEEANIRGYGPGRFSFNTKDGRCNNCDGDGMKKIEMHFLPPVYVECEDCKWKRYNFETLEVKYRGKTIFDVLEMTVDEAMSFFANHPKVTKILSTLEKVGLGYIKLWQSSTTLSWWEAQRVKLATELSKRSTTTTFYILDEPTTGLHFQDVDRLMTVLHSLVNTGNSVLVIEHNMDVIMNADYIIDIWPEWGDAGGKMLVSGTREEVQQCKKSYTAKAILRYLGSVC